MKALLTDAASRDGSDDRCPWTKGVRLTLSLSMVAAVRGVSVINVGRVGEVQRNATQPLWFRVETVSVGYTR